MLALPLTLLGLISGLALAHSFAIRSFPARALFAGLIASAQIVAIETLLGGIGVLSRPALASSSVLCSGALLLAAVLGYRRGLRGSHPLLGARALLDGLRRDAASLWSGAAQLRHPEVAALLAVAALGWTWALAAIVFLPPRSVDDLAHHLPPVLEAAIRGRFVILPLELRPWFAYPLNADLLFLWPTVLRGDIRWTDGAQALTAALSAVAIVAIARELGASRRSSLCTALLFLLFPVTLKQATSCYTDITLAAFYGAAVWGAMKFAREGSAGPLLLCGLASGLLAGTKYHFLLPLAALLPLVLLGTSLSPSRARGWLRAGLLFALPSLLLCGYWYCRNLLRLGNPFYPYGLGIGSLTLFRTALPPTDDLVAAPSFLREALVHPTYLLIPSLRDAGAGGVDGGLGPVFWGMVLPVGMWSCAQKAWRFRRERDPAGLLLALQFPAAFLPFLVSPFPLFDTITRYFLPAAVLGLAFLAVALDGARHRWPVSVALATALGIVASALSLFLLGGTRDLHERKQMMIFGPAADAARSGAFSSPWRFIAGGSHGTGRFARGWELLDLLSAPPGRPVRPLWIYATGQYPAGFYGTRLQNRIWNFAEPASRPAEPEVFFYYLTIHRKEADITYFGQPLHKLAEVASDPDRYELVLITSETLVYLRRDLLQAGTDLRDRLATYYENVFPEEVATASSLRPQPAGGTILNSGPVGYGLKALELRGRLRARVVLARVEDLPTDASRFHAGGPVYLIQRAATSGERAAGTMVGTMETLSLRELTGSEIESLRHKSEPEEKEVREGEDKGESP